MRSLIAMLVAGLAAPVLANTDIPHLLICETIGMHGAGEGSLIFERPGDAFLSSHDGRVAADDPASPMHGFPAMMALDWEQALDWYMADNSYRIVLMDMGRTADGAYVLHHFAVTGVFDEALRSRALVNHCTPIESQRS